MMMQTISQISGSISENFISIGDVSKLIGIPTHTIRYWEKEFSDYLVPARTIGKQRRYGEDQISKLQTIFRMLKQEGYSIAGAKRALATQNRKANLSPELPESLDAAMAERIITLIKQQLEKGNGLNTAG